MPKFGKSSRGTHSSSGGPSPRGGQRPAAGQRRPQQGAQRARTNQRNSQQMDARLPRVDARGGNPGAFQRMRPAQQQQRRGGNPGASQRMQAIPSIADMAPANEAVGSYADLAQQDGVQQKLGPVVISLRNVTKVYPTQPDRPALNGLTLDVRAGEFLFLVGHSGSGKSTFIRMLNREIVPTSGELIVAGENLRTIKNWRIPYLRRNVGCVFQDFKLLPDKTTYENVAFALEAIGKPKSVIKAQVPEVLRLVGLQDKMDNYPDQLSGGEQQRVAVARAMVNRPPLLVCDEPTGNLDPAISLGIMKLLERINRTGTTVIVATHDRAMVDSMRRRVIALEAGHVIRDQERGGYGNYGA